MTNLISMCWKCIHWEEGCKMFMKVPNPNITECKRFVKSENEIPQYYWEKKAEREINNDDRNSR